MTQRVYNFSAGPAVLPEEVLRRAQTELMALPGLGMSILEISHRSQPFTDILNATEANLRQLLNLPDNYRVLFLQGGSRLQFSMAPMNLLAGGSADYIVSGSWGQMALVEAQREGAVSVAWDGKQSGYNCLPEASDLKLDDRAAYVHFTSNETIQGVQFPVEPQTGDVPLVCDASSDFLSRPLDIERYGMIYSCAQKNAGPAGVTVVIIRDDMVDRSPADIAGMLSYRNHVENNSCYNTPPTFGVYVVQLVTEWLLNTVGGLEAMHRRNKHKAELLYAAVDSSGGFYEPHAAPASLSMMNVIFRLPNDDLQQQFLDGAKERHLCNLKGHRSVGGIRASIYNAMPQEGVAELAKFMDEFRGRHC